MSPQHKTRSNKIALLQVMRELHPDTWTSEQEVELQDHLAEESAYREELAREREEDEWGDDER